MDIYSLIFCIREGNNIEFNIKFINQNIKGINLNYLEGKIYY